MHVSTILGARGFLLVALLIWALLVAMSIAASKTEEGDTPRKRRRVRPRSNGPRRSLSRVRSPQLIDRDPAVFSSRAEPRASTGSASATVELALGASP